MTHTVWVIRYESETKSAINVTRFYLLKSDRHSKINESFQGQRQLLNALKKSQPTRNWLSIFNLRVPVLRIYSSFRDIYFSSKPFNTHTQNQKSNTTKINSRALTADDCVVIVHPRFCLVLSLFLPWPKKSLILKPNCFLFFFLSSVRTSTNHVTISHRTNLSKGQYGLV